MKKFLKIFLGFLAVVALGVIAAFYLTADLPKTADQFFTAVKNNNMDEAYSLVSEDFKSGTSKDQLREFLNDNALGDYANASWDNRSVNGGRGSLKGTITSSRGVTVPLEIGFLKTDSGWKIYSIHKPASGVGESTNSLSVPAEDELLDLVAQSIDLFGSAVRQESMTSLYDQLSNIWQQQVSVEQLDEVFDTFYGTAFDFQSVDNLKPAFTSEPAIDEDGVLKISGFYPAPQAKLVFQLKYYKEGLSWKLLGINIELID